MASRTTLRKAEELKEQMQEWVPAVTLRIIDRSETRRIGRGVAEMEGYKIVEDDGGIMVLAEVTQFDVVEVRQCACGAEVLTIAIGEAGLDECQACKRKRQKWQAEESMHSSQASRASVAAHMAFDEYSEPS